MVFEALNEKGRNLVALAQAKLDFPSRLSRSVTPPGFSAPCIVFDDLYRLPAEVRQSRMAQLSLNGFTPDVLSAGYSSVCKQAFITTLTGPLDPRLIAYRSIYEPVPPNR